MFFCITSIVNLYIRDMEKLNVFIKNNIYASITVFTVVFFSIYLLTAIDRYEIVTSNNTIIKYHKGTGQSWVKVMNKWHKITDEKKEKVDKFWEKQVRRSEQFFE